MVGREPTVGFAMRRVREQETRVAEQLAQIAQLKARGRSTILSERLLDQMNELLLEMRARAATDPKTEPR